MSTPSITALNVVNGEVQWNAPIYDIYAVAQIIQEELLLFQGEWWANLNDGLPLWQAILGQGASQASLEQMEVIIGARILACPYVTSLSNVATTFNPQTRAFAYSADVQTSLGTIQLTNIPIPFPAT